MTTKSVACMGFVLLASLSSCSKQPLAEPMPPASPDPEIPVSAPGDAAETAAREAAERAAAARREAERVRTVLEQRIHFDYNESHIRDDARRILDSKLPLIRDDPTLRLRIEGHADERGSTEYNLALGTRRASSVVSYFSGFGIDGSRFPIASYGEERPLLNGSDEAAWAQNRRAEFVIIAGAVLGASGPDR